MLEKYLNFLLGALIIFSISCSSKKEFDQEECMVNSDLVFQYLKEHSFSKNEIYGIQQFMHSQECGAIDSFLRISLVDEISRNRAGDMFEDSLFAFLEMEIFENFISQEKNEHDEIIRLIKSNFAFGKQTLTVVEGHQKRNKIEVKNFKVTFDDKCNTPFFTFPNGKVFSKKCFKIKEKNRRNIGKKDWNELRKIMLETDFKSTSYFTNGVQICDGNVYSIEYSSGSKIVNETIRLTRSCPGKKTAIFLVGEKLIELANKN